MSKEQTPELRPNGIPYKIPRPQREKTRCYQARAEVKQRRHLQFKTQPWYLRSIARRVRPGQYVRQVRVAIPVLINVERDGDSCHAYCPMLKGLHTEGKGITQAVANAKLAAEAYIRSLVKHGEYIPTSLECHNK